jgi:hypothetical protein
MRQHKQQDLLPVAKEPRRQALIRKREDLLVQLSRAVRGNQPKRSRKLLSRINQINELESLYEALQQRGRDEPTGESALYTVSSLFLFESFLELTADKKEQLFFVTGPQVSDTFVLDQRIRFVHERRTAGGVTGSLPDTHRVLILLETFGHRLVAHFHSHPGFGADATTPSPIDQDFQRRLEQAGHVAVAAIFSRDGWIRFFRNKGPVRIRVYGEGIEQHETNIFRLTNVPAGCR